MHSKEIRRTSSYAHIISLCFCWYVISSLGSQVTKSILTVYPKPLFLGEFQFIYTALLASICCLIAYHCEFFYRSFPEGTFPRYHSDNSDQKCQRSIITRPTKHMLMTVLPLSLFQFAGKYFGHTATSLVPVSTVASIKTLSPVFIVLIQKLLRINTLQLNGLIYFSLACLIIGVWVIVREDSEQQGNVFNKANGPPTEYSYYGIISAVSSMLIFVAQNIYGKEVFTFKQENSLPQDLKAAKAGSPLPIYSERMATSAHLKKYDKLTLMIYIPLVGFCLSLGWFMTLELPMIWSGVKQDGLASIPWKLIFLNGTFHFLQAMITFHLLGEVSTLTYSIANLMKRIVIITVSWAFAGRSVNIIQILGLLLNMLGLFIYERYRSKTRQGKVHLK